MKKIGKRLSLFLIGLVGFYTFVNGQVTTNQPSLHIETCDATFPTDYFTLDDLVFSESLAGDFIAGTAAVSIVLPTNFEFDITTSPTLTETGNDISSLTLGSPSFADNKTFQLNITITAGATTLDEFTISGLQIRGTTNVTVLSNITYTITSSLFVGMPSGSKVAAVQSGSLSVTSGGTASSSQVLCEGEIPAELTIAGESISSDPAIGATTLYQWQRSLDNNTWTDVSGEVAATYTPPALASSTYYRRQTTLSRNGISCSSPSTSVFLELNKITPGAIGPNQSICENSTASNIVQGTPASVSGALSFQWESNTGSGWADISSATQPTYSPGVLTQTTQFRRGDISTLNGEVCEKFTNIVTITVLSAVDGGTAEVSAGVTDQTVCSGETPVDITVSGSTGGTSYIWQSSTDNASFTNIPGEVSAALSFIVTPAITTYYKRISVSTGTGSTCTDESSVSTIFVNSISAGTIGSAQTICNGTTASPLTQGSAAVAAGVLTYQWESNTGSGWSDIVSATQPTYAPGAIAQTTQYRRRDISTMNGEACWDWSNTIAVTVLPAVVGGTAEISPGTTNQTVCSNDIPVDIVVNGSSGGSSYQWYISTDDITYTIIPGGVSETLSFASAPSQTTFYSRRSIANGTGTSCSDFSSASIVYVNQIIKGSVAADQTVCGNSTASILTQVSPATATGTLTYQWEYDDGGGWSDVPSAIQPTYAPGVVAQTTQYRRRDISTLNGEVCVDWSNTVTITVLPAVDGGTAEVSSGVADQTICSGETPTDIIVSGAVGGTSYIWQSSTDDINFSDITGEVGASLTFSAAPSQTTFYRRKTVNTINTSCYDFSSSSTVFINSIAAGTIGSEQTICNGTIASSLTQVTSATAAGTLTYQWESNTGSGWSDIASATQPTYAPGMMTQTTQYRRRDISTLNGKGCVDWSNGITITVLPAVVGGTAEISPGTPDQTVCSSDIPAKIEVTGSSGGSLYIWQSSTDGVNFSDITGEVSPSLTFSSTPPVTTHYRRKSYNVQNGLECAEYSSVSMVYVNHIQPGVIGNNQTQCYGDPSLNIIELSAAIPEGSISYQWEKSTNLSTWSAISGETQTTYNPGNLTQTTYFRRVDTSKLNAVDCSGNTNVVTIQVLGQVAGGTSSGDETLCAADVPSTITVTGTIGSSGQWEKSIDNVNWSSVPGETGLSLVFSNPLAQTTYYRRKVTNSIGGFSCNDYSSTTIKTLNYITAGTIASSDVVCYGTNLPNFTETAAPVYAGSIGYQWEYKVGAGNWTEIVGATNPTYSPGAITQTTQFRRVDSSTLNSLECSNITNTLTIDVLPEVDGGTASADQTICSDEIPATITVTGAIGTLAQWEYSIDNVIFTPISGETGVSLTFSAALAQTTYYRRRTSNLINGVECYDYSTTTAKFVNSIDPGTVGTSLTVCYGTILSNFTEVDLPSGAGSLSYEWESKVGTGNWTTISGATNPTYSPGTMLETTLFRRLVTSTLNSVDCSDYTNELTIEVSGNFEAGTAAPASQTVCQGGDPAKITVTGGITVDVTYQWYQSTDGGVNFTAIVGETGPEYDPPLGIATSTHFKRETISDTPSQFCSDFTNPVYVEVIAFDPGQISGDQTVCEGDSPGTITSVANAMSNGVTTYHWESSTDLINWTVINLDQQTYTPGVLAETTYFKRVATSVLNGVTCSVETNISAVYVNRFANSSSHKISYWDGSFGPVNVCYGASPGPLIDNFTLESNIGATITYQWQSSTDNVNWTSIGGATGATYNPSPVTADIFYRRVSTTTLNGVSCPLESNSIKIIVGANVNPGEVETTNPNSISGSTLIEVVAYGGIPSQINETVAATGDGSIFRHLWYISTDGVNFIPAPGTNDGINYTPVDPVAENTWFRRVYYNTFFSVECGAYSVDTEVQIIVPSPGTLNNDQVICEGDDPGIIQSLPNTTESTIYLTYQWESSTDNISFNPIPGANSISYNPVAGEFPQTTYLRRITNTIINGADQGEHPLSNTDVVIVHVNTVIPGAIGSAQSICFNTTPANLTNVALATTYGATSYLWESSFDNTNWAVINGETATTYSFSSPLVQTTYYRRRDISTYNGISCYKYTPSVKIEVTQVLGGTASSDQTVCSADAPGTISVTGEVGNFAIWQDSIVGGNWSDITGETGTSISFAGSIAETTFYRRKTWSSLSGNSCTDYSTVSAVYVNEITPGVIGSDQTLCNGSFVANLTEQAGAVATGVIAYQWQNNTSGSWNDISGATSATYSPGVLTQTTRFRRQVISTFNGFACANYTNEVIINILPNVNGGTTNGDQVVCATDNPASIVVTGSTGSNIQWQSSPDGVSNWTDIAGENGTILAFANTIIATTYYRMRIWETLNGVTCEKYSPIITIFVNEISPGTIGNDQVVCYNSAIANFTVTNPAAGSGVLSFQWEKNDAGTWDEILNANQATYSPGLITQTTLFRRKVTSTKLGQECSDYTNEVTIEVIPEVLPGTSNGDQIVCSNDTPSPIVITGSQGTNAQWQSSADGSTNWTDIAGETGTALTFSVPITADTYYRLRRWSTIGALTCEEFSPVVKITLNKITPGVISSDQVLCYGSSVSNFTVTTPATGKGTLSYQWEKNDAGTWDEIVNATQSTYSPGVITQTTLYRRKDISTWLGQECSAYTNEVTVEVVSEVRSGISNGDQIVCSTDTPLPIVITGSLGINAQWQASADGTTNWTDMAGETGTILTFADPITADTYYRLRSWSTIGALTCEEFSPIVRITLNQITPGIIGADQVLCYGSLVSNFTVTTPASGTGILSYQWEKNDAGTWDEIVGATQSTYSPGQLTQTTQFRRKDVSTMGGSPCSDYTNIVTVEIFDELEGGTASADQYVCLSEVPAPISTDGIKGASAIWQKSEDGTTWVNITGETGKTISFSTALATTTHYRWVTWTETVDQTCSDTSTVSTVHVNIIEAGEISADQLICEGDQAAALIEVVAAVHVGQLTHQWETSTDLFNWTAIAGATEATFGTPQPIETTYYRRKDISTISGGNACSAYTNTIKITVDDYPVIDAQSIVDNDITSVSCNGGDDGSIVIPTSRITGGNVAQKQIVNVILSGTPAVDDVYTIIINGVSFSHVVGLNASNNTETNAEIASALASVVTSGAVSVTVLNETITLTAQIAGTSFNAFASTGASVDGKMLTQVVQENVLPNTYEWSKIGSPGIISTSLSMTGLEAGFYQLLVSNSICTDTAVFEVPEPDPILIEIDTTCNNSLSAKISGGNLNYTVTLIKPDNTTVVKTSSGDVSFTGLERGLTYTIRVEDAPCDQVFTKIVTLPLSLVIDDADITVTDVQCGGEDNGSIILGVNAVRGGVEPYRYSWSIFEGSNKVQIATSRSLIDIGAGTYYLDVEDNRGCTAAYSTTIEDKDPIVISGTVTNQNQSCPGDASAEISIGVTSDPSSVLEIHWFRDGQELLALQNQLEITNLDAALYHVEVVDVSVAPFVCMESDTFEITEPEPFVVTETEASDIPDCYSETYRGSVIYQVTGGTEPYNYQVDDGAVVAFTPDANGFIEIADLDTGLHTITFSELNHCDADIVVEHTVTTPAPIEITYDESDVLNLGCSAKGSITVQVSGGTPPYFYEWSGPNNFSRIGTNLSHLTDIDQVGIYTLQVTDHNQCKSEEIAIEIIEQTTDFTVTEVIRNGDCASNNDASIELTVSDNIVVPYTVEWEKWDLTDPSDPNCISNCYSWQPIPSASGQLFLNDLGPGQYKVTIVDGSNTICDTYVKTFNLAESSIEMYDEAVRLPDCGDTNYGYRFKMKAENSLNFYLNGTQISQAAGSLIYNSSTEEYIIKNLSPGNYLLRIVEIKPSGDEGCEILENFAIGQFEVLSYSGPTSHELDVCSNIYTFTLDTSAVSGGFPFKDGNGNSFYNYEWTSPSNTTTTGFKDVPVSIGVYQLVVKDSRGCLTDPILFNFTVTYNAIQVTESIQSVSCGGAVNDGVIEIAITGGREPYSINWEKEVVNNGATSYTSVATDVTRIENLSSGRYRLTVLSDFDNCENSNNPIVRYETIYTVHKDETVTILDGPYLSTELCEGTPGILTIQVSEVDNGSTLFYYNEQLVNASFIGNGTYEVLIDFPTSDALLTAVNEAGCSAFVIIEEGVANPSFRFESDGFLQFGITGVGEEIEFINTTTDVYDSLTWDFGDGSDILPLTAVQERTTDVFHSYVTEGRFDVTLTVFNSAGCSNEVENMVIIGKGYSVIFPTAFTPNDDGINDYFEGEFTGIVAFTLNIYDTWNNLIFTTSHETASLPVNWGWNGRLSNGSPFNSQVFKYVFYGTRLNGEVIVKSDNAIIIK